MGVVAPGEIQVLVACNRWSKSQSHLHGIRWCSVATTLFSVRLGFYGRPPPPQNPFKIHCQFMVYGDGIMEMQHVRKWCRYYGAGQSDIRDDRNGRPDAYRTDVNGARLGELILDDRQSHHHRYIPCNVVVYRDRTLCHSKSPFQNWINALLDSRVFDEG